MTQEIFDAINRHDVECLVTLLAQGVDPDQLNTGFLKQRPLHAAVLAVSEGGPLELIRLLLRYGAGIDESPDPDLGGHTPLLLALYNDQFEAARLLLDAGADPNVRSNEGHSPLRACAEQGFHEMAALVLAMGANRTIESCDPILGATALGMAVRRLDVPMVRLLLEAGADPDHLDLDYETAEDRLPPREEADAGPWTAIAAMLSAGRRDA